jgi:hypothetical protein
MITRKLPEFLPLYYSPEAKFIDVFRLWSVDRVSGIGPAIKVQGICAGAD